jgi:Flp pilus assembly protein TadG
MRAEGGAKMPINAAGIGVEALRTAPYGARKRGSALIEFAVASMVFLAFVFGTIDFARFLYAYEFVTFAARAGARYAMVRGATCAVTNDTAATPNWCGSGGPAGGVSALQIQTFVQGMNLPGIDPSNLTINTTITFVWPATGVACNSTNGINFPGCPVQVQVSYPYVSSIPFVHIKTFTLYATSEMVISE